MTDAVLLIPCGHTTSLTSLQNWLRNSQKCPICDADLSAYQQHYALQRQIANFLGRAIPELNNDTVAIAKKASAASKSYSNNTTPSGTTSSNTTPAAASSTPSSASAPSFASSSSNPKTSGMFSMLFNRAGEPQPSKTTTTASTAATTSTSFSTSSTTSSSGPRRIGRNKRNNALSSIPQPPPQPASVKPSGHNLRDTARASLAAVLGVDPEDLSDSSDDTGSGSDNDSTFRGAIAASKQQEQPSVSTGELATALYNYEAAGANEVSFLMYDLMEVLKKDPSGWWEVKVEGGRVGWAPANY
eukprot:CAMPEP_0174239310 /NCGR_PEP_ID=MMETSP0417-20130205/14195_1 /TAXON_ID=242541 /ORGANISM="Mayorella sp, Strain BSH-02190019" /LENGTH=300 /DNA_ID=CAMNT_0015318245 /DNA_START=9 /DNA_END=908 /DNA_ORIENTATION=+